MNERLEEIRRELRELSENGTDSDAERATRLIAEYRKLTAVPRKPAPCAPTERERWLEVIQMRRGYGFARIIA